MIPDWQLNVLKERIDEKKFLIRRFKDRNLDLMRLSVMDGNFFSLSRISERYRNDEIIFQIQQELAQDLALYKELTNNK